MTSQGETLTVSTGSQVGAVFFAGQPSGVELAARLAHLEREVRESWRDVLRKVARLDQQEADLAAVAPFVDDSLNREELKDGPPLR